MKLYEELNNVEKYIVMRIFGSEYFKNNDEIQKATNLYRMYDVDDLYNASEIERFYWEVAQANKKPIYNAYVGQKAWDDYRSIN
jgi:hypothetical protein